MLYLRDGDSGRVGTQLCKVCLLSNGFGSSEGTYSFFLLGTPLWMKSATFPFSNNCIPVRLFEHQDTGLKEERETDEDYSSLSDRILNLLK